MLSSTATTRRAFLGAVAGTAGVALAALIAAPAAAAVAPSTAWKLVNGRHCRCRACRTHAANKIFASEAAALAARAHPACRCTAVEFELTPASYGTLFHSETSVDRRDAGTAAQVMPAVLNSSATAPSVFSLPAAASADPADPDGSADPVAGGPVAAGPHGSDPIHGPHDLAGRTQSAVGSTDRSLDIDARWLPAPILAVGATIGGLIWLRTRRADPAIVAAASGEDTEPIR
jgi:hypothetical protein